MCSLDKDKNLFKNFKYSTSNNSLINIYLRDRSKQNEEELEYQNMNEDLIRKLLNIHFDKQL